MWVIVDRQPGQRRLRLIQANVLSTIQRLGKTSIRDRFTICNFQTPVRQTTSALFWPAYPPSAKIRSKGKHASRPTQRVEGAITILNTSRMNDDAQQEA